MIFNKISILLKKPCTVFFSEEKKKLARKPEQDRPHTRRARSSRRLSLSLSTLNITELSQCPTSLYHLYIPNQNQKKTLHSVSTVSSNLTFFSLLPSPLLHTSLSISPSSCNQQFLNGRFSSSGNSIIIAFVLALLCFLSYHGSC